MTARGWAALACALAAALVAPVTTAAAPGCDPGWPVVAFRASTGVPQPEKSDRMPVACGVATGYATSETSMAAANGGALLFSPANSENTMARSSDDGASWNLVGPTRLQYTSLWNTVDPAVVVDRQTGRLFWAHTTYTEDLRWPFPDQSPASWFVPTFVAYAHGFQVFSSSDDGVSWSTADYRIESTADWEKIFVGPPPAPKSGAAQPQSYPNIVYLCANAPEEVIGPGRGCHKSVDGGATFSATGYEFPSPTAPADCPPLAANTGVVDSAGVVYIPQSCYDGTYVAVSSDEAASFTWLPVGEAPAATGLGAVVQLAIDAADNLYLLWVAGDSLALARSSDGGKSWMPAMKVSPPDLHKITLPALAAGGRGAVGVAYYATTDRSQPKLSAYVAQTANADASTPVFHMGPVNDPAHPIYEDGRELTTPRADFIGAEFDASGRFWGAFAKQLSEPDAAGRIATTGWVGHLAFPSQQSISACAARRLVITLPRRKRTRFASATVFVNGSRVARFRGHALKRVTLRTKRRRSFTVTVVATTDRGGRNVVVRRYRTSGCS